MVGSVPGAEGTSTAETIGINTITGISDYSGSAAGRIRTAGVAGFAIGQASQSIIQHIGVYGSSSKANNHYAAQFVGAKTYAKQLVIGGDDSSIFNIVNPALRLGSTFFELTVEGHISASGNIVNDGNVNVSGIGSFGTVSTNHITASGNITASGFVYAKRFYAGGSGLGDDNDSPNALITSEQTGSLLKSVTPSATQGVLNKITAGGSTTGLSVMTNLGTSGKPTFAAITAIGEITSSTLKVVLQEFI